MLSVLVVAALCMRQLQETSAATHWLLFIRYFS